MICITAGTIFFKNSKKKLQKKSRSIGVFIVCIWMKTRRFSWNVSERPSQTANRNSGRMRLHNQLRFLWRSELISIIRKYKLGGVTAKNKLELVRTMERHLTKDALRSELLESLIERDYSQYQE